jgi:hypothetical protein
VIELPNGRIVAAGGFSDLNGEAGTQGIVMLRSNGTRDESFVSGANQAPTVYGLVFDAADNSLLVGAFTFGYAGVNSQIHRLGLNGARDGSLMVTTDNTLRAMALQADRKIVVGGDFTSVQGVARLGLARLHPDGTLDASFTAQSAILATNTVGDVKTIALEADGDIVVAGGFVAIEPSSFMWTAKVG